MFMSDLLPEPLITQPPSSLSDLIELYNSTLSSLFDKHAPFITTPISSRPSNPCFTPYLHGLKATRRRKEKAWKRSSDSYDAMRLRLITSLYHHSIIKATQVYQASLIAANKLLPKRLWQTVNTILPRRPTTILPSSAPSSSLADKFCIFLH
jgi:hypothetical protein